MRLPEDEAASIAFHLVNSEFGGMRLRDTQIMTEIIRHPDRNDSGRLPFSGRPGL